MVRVIRSSAILGCIAALGFFACGPSRSDVAEDLPAEQLPAPEDVPHPADIDPVAPSGPESMQPLTRNVDGGTTLREQYDVGYAGMNGGAWFKNDHNEEGLLAWGESYVLMSFITMYRTTQDASYLAKLIEHADGVLAQRDSARNVLDYRGRADPCWRANRRDYATKPYCFAVHSGMIASPMVEFAVLVKKDPSLASYRTYDGKTFGEKAALYVQAGLAAAKVHEDEFRASGANDGFYVFRPDMASFYPGAGKRQPLNMMNAMGLLHLGLADATGDATHLDRARRLANHFLSTLTVAPDGGYRWNYLEGPFAAPGEDVSHAAINVAFALRAAQSNIVFGPAHLARFAKTFTGGIYVDSVTSNGHIGGGALNQNQAQLPRWSLLSLQDPTIHAAIRNYLPPVGRMGSILYGVSLLAQTRLFVRPWDFYVADWQDLGDTRRTTMPDANIQMKPANPKVSHLVRLRYQSATRVPVQQWDGKGYHTVAVLAPSSTLRTAYVATRPDLYFDYGGAGVLFQFRTGAGFVLAEPETIAAPRFTTTPPATAQVGATVSYTPHVEGDGRVAIWVTGSPDATAKDGTLTVKPSAAGTLSLTVRAETEFGAVEQVWSLAVSGP